jgi:Asp-tRNA(Asn)/Glu-tRNA(Gln) amidotransferase A subunit family amidase
MQTFLRAIEFLSLSLWLGGDVFLSFVVAPGAFSILGNRDVDLPRDDGCDADLLRPRELLLLRNTRPVNVWGLPAISIPCGFTETGLPIGLQIIGPHWAEARVLQVAHAYEQATAWHKRKPLSS